MRRHGNNFKLESSDETSEAYQLLAPLPERERMRVLFVTANFPHLGNAMNGIHISELADALREKGVEVRVLHLLVRVSWPFSRLRRYEEVRCGGEEGQSEWVVRWEHRSLPRAIGMLGQARRWGRRAARFLEAFWPQYVPDIVNAHAFVPAGVVADELARAIRRPLVTTTHGGDTRVWLGRRRGRMEIERLCGRTERVICVSEMLAAQLRESGLGCDIRVIPNGMAPGKLCTGENPVARRFAGKRLVVGMGNLIPTKGFSILLRAVSTLMPAHSNLCVAIVGGGHERVELERLTQKLGLEGRVELTGPLPPGRAMEYVAACEVFCLPSWSEGFGVAFLEAMAHGKPVIAVRGQGVASIIERNGAGLLVEPRNVESVAVALASLLSHPGMAEAMGRRGARLVREQMTWDRSAAAYETEYREVCAEFAAAGKTSELSPGL